jgi:MFS family permease
MSAPTYNKWSNLALLRLNAFGVGINGFYLAVDTVVLPVLILILAPEALKNTYLAVLGLSGFFVAAVMQIIVGRLSDRTRSPLGKRVPYLLGGCVLISVGIVGIGFAPTFWLLFGVWMFIQANINISYGPYQALIQDLIPGTRTGVASAFKILADVIGGVAFIKISTVFMGWYDFGGSIEWLWITLGVLGINLVVAAGITSATVLARQGKLDSQLPKQESHPTASSGLHPQLVQFLISRWLLVTAIVVFQTYGLFFLRDKVGLESPVQDLGNMVLVIGGAVAAGAYLAGRFSDRIGRKPVILAGAAGATVSTVLILWAGSVTEVLVIASFIGFSVGMLLSSNWAMANEMGTAGKEAFHMSVVNLSTIGGAATAKMLGPGVDLLNRMSPASGYSALLVGCAIFFVLGGILLVPLKTKLNEA